MQITQETIDGLVPELNNAIKCHNKYFPDAKLRGLPETRRVIFLRNRKALEDRFEMSFENSPAFHYKEKRLVYLVREKLDDEITAFQTLIKKSVETRFEPIKGALL